MTSITIYDGANTIGGNKIYLEEKEKGIFLDFGMNFKKYGDYFQEYLSWRSSRGIHDLIQLNLIPKLNIYRKDLIPSDLDISSYPSLNVNAILLSHAHLDHFGNMGLLDSKFPIIASPTTIMLLKGILDSSFAVIGSEVAYFSSKISGDDDRTIKAPKRNEAKDLGRNFVSTKDYSDACCEFLTTCVKSRKKLEEGSICHLNDFSSHYEISAFDVDHSIYGATGYLISGDTNIAYTGDFRLHGKMGETSKNFIHHAKDASILIIEGTRAAREDINESEEIVYDNCLKAINESKGLIIADFTSRNFERLETFHKIAIKVGRTLIVTAKDAYLLNALDKVDGKNRTKGLLIYGELRTTTKGWEDNFLTNDMDIHYIDPLDISKNADKYILCFSFFDMKHLLDIKPEGGTYIYSSSEAFEEEAEFDFIRLNNWLTHFGFKIYGFEISRKKDPLKPKFQKGFHASGHASKSDLIWAIETINPDVIIPVHTDNPEWFIDSFENVSLIKDGKSFRI
jgi:ribonuclease J